MTSKRVRVYSVSAYAAELSFIGAVVGVPLATVLAGSKFVLEDLECPEHPVGLYWLLVVTLLLVSFRYFLRAQSIFRRCLRNLILNNLPKIRRRRIVATHGILVFLSCLNVSAILVLGIEAALAVLLVQCAIVFFQWLLCYNEIFTRPNPVNRKPTWVRYVCAHYVTLMVDAFYVLLIGGFLVTFFLITGDYSIDPMSIASLLAFITILTLLEPVLHSKSL